LSCIPAQALSTGDRGVPSRCSGIDAENPPRAGFLLGAESYYLPLEIIPLLTVTAVENGEVIDLIRPPPAPDDIKYCFDIGHWFTRGLPQSEEKKFPAARKKSLRRSRTAALPGDLNDL